MILDPLSPVPLYHQLTRAISRQIAAGHWAAHAAIPSERELIQRYGVSRTTVRQALAQLVAAGALYRQHGKGTFVSPARPIVSPLSDLTGHVEELHRRGLDVSARLIRLVEAAAPAEVVAALDLPPNAIAVVVERVVFVAGAPLLHLTIWLPLALGRFITPESAISVPIYQTLEQNNVFLVRGRQRIRAIPAAPAVSDRLEVAPGAPLLEVFRVLHDAEGQPLEWSLALYHPERYEYEVDLRRRGFSV